jgi:hypothetical protein
MVVAELANYCDNLVGDLASRDLFAYVSFVFVAQIKFQVEAYMCRHIKFTNTQIEYGHLVMCICASV